MQKKCDDNGTILLFLNEKKTVFNYEFLKLVFVEHRKKIRISSEHNEKYSSLSTL